MSRHKATLYNAAVPGFATRAFGLIRDLWQRALRERSTPREIGLSVGLGAFVACSPFIGFHLWIALALATLLKLNRVWAMIGSRLSTTPVLLATTFAGIQVAHYARTRTWASIRLHQSLQDAQQLLIDWALGSVLIGTIVGVTAGLTAAALARRWQQLNPRGLGALPPRSSESPP
jgi:uncharacterized protein (DUF2062 family)